LGVGTKPRRQLHRRSKDVVVLFDRFPGRATNTNFDVMIVFLSLTPSQLSLDLHCTTDRGSGRNKRGHDAIASVLNFTAPRRR
jgi:hypothetical protein